MLKDKFHELPSLDKTEFEYYTWGIPSYLLYILLPVGVIVFINTYLKLTALSDKLKGIERTLNTISFFSKAYA